jgi:hypothetical protein
MSYGSEQAVVGNNPFGRFNSVKEKSQDKINGTTATSTFTASCTAAKTMRIAWSHLCCRNAGENDELG